MDRRRALYLAVRFGVLAIALAILAVDGPAAFRHVRPVDLVAPAILLIFFAALVRINVPLSQSLARRRRPEPGRVALELPIILTVVSLYGPVFTAAFAIAGYALAIRPEGRWHLVRRLLDGGAQAVLWLALGALYQTLWPGPVRFSLAAYVGFVALYVAGIYVFLYVVWLPLRALAKRVHVQRLWRALSRDTRLVAFLALLASWGYVCTMVWLHAGEVLALACFGPVLFLAGTLRALNDRHVELHRLRLARDAVQAMIGKGDPLPQMKSLLASIHVAGSRETLQIHAAIAPDQSRLLPLATIGPPPTTDQLDVCRRALSELRNNDRAAVTLRSGGGTIFAHAARSDNGELLGALVSYRSLFGSDVVPAARLMRAAAELGPLLRDFRAIAATKTAAAIDALTGLYNRRTTMELLRRQLEISTARTPCAILLIDVDQFKSINDALGHQAGDAILRTLASIIARSVRANDRAGRIGGEEFVIVMPDTNIAMAAAAAERLRGEVAAGELKHADGGPVTVSIGVAVAADDDTPDSLFARADRALYAAKRQGRNRVVPAKA